MKYLKKFNEASSYQEPFIYKSPEGLIEDIKEIFYLLSDYGCELDYDDSNSYELDINITPIEINKSFSGIEELVKLRNRLKDDNDYIYASKIIEVCSHLNQLKDERGGFHYILYETPASAVSLDDDITIEIKFDHDYKAIINDVNGRIYLNDDLIITQLKYINVDAEYEGWELDDNLFILDFFLNKKYPLQPLLDHFNLIMGEYFKFSFHKDEADDFEESGDYLYQLTGDLIKGEVIWLDKFPI